MWQYLKMRAWQFNDIKSAVQWSIRRYDSMEQNDLDADAKRHKRKLLLDIVFEVYGPDDDDVKAFT